VSITSAASAQDLTIDTVIAHPISIDFSEIPKALSELPLSYTYSFSGLDLGYSFGNIRGFDQRRQAISINGIPQNDPEDLNVSWTLIPDLLASVSEVQVKTGVGSAAVVNLETNIQTNRELTVSAGYGDYNTSKLAINLNSGLIENKYLISGRFSQLKTDGYRDNASIDEKSYRVSMERRDTDFTLKLNFYGGPVKDGLYYYGIFPGENNDRTNFTDPILRKTNWSETFLYERRAPEHEEFSQPHYEAITSWNINPDTKFFNTLFYIQGDGSFDYDGTWVSPHASEYFRLTPVYGFRYNFTGINDTSLGNELIRSSVTEHQFGWLPRIEYSDGQNIFSAAGEFRIHRSDHWGQLVSAQKLPLGLPDNYHFYEYNGGKDIFSGTLSDQYEFTKKFKASAGIQFINDEYRFFNEKPFYLDSTAAAFRGLKQTGWTNYTFAVPLFFVNPRLGLDLRLNDFVSTFASAALTNREPQLKDYYNAEFFSNPNFNRNPDGSFNFGSPKIEPEHLVDLELGTQVERFLLDDDILFSGGITGYYMPINEELLQTGRVDQWGSPIIANAGTVDHYGIELNGRFEIGIGVVLKVNIAASHNEIKDFPQYSDSVHVAGKVPVGFPSLIAGASLLLMPFKGLTIGVTGRYVGAMYGDLTNSSLFHNDPYGVVDAMLGYKEKNVLGLQYVELRIEVNNILNTFYTSYVESGTGFFVAAPRHGYATIQIAL
jgi:iron complex outermembrane receptor protein